jgi:flagellar biosynthesis protein FlhA
LPILSSISQAVQVTQDHDRIVDLVRADLGGMIVGRICSPRERLPVVTLEASLEAMIAGGLVDPISGQPVIEPDLARNIGEQAAAIVAERGTGATIALIVQPRLRRPLAALLRLRAPGCVVMSISELPETQPVEVIAVIGGTVAPTLGLPSPEFDPSSPTAESVAA